MMSMMMIMMMRYLELRMGRSQKGCCAGTLLPQAVLNHVDLVILSPTLKITDPTSVFALCPTAAFAARLYHHHDHYHIHHHDHTHHHTHHHHTHHQHQHHHARWFFLVAGTLIKVYWALRACLCHPKARICGLSPN